VGRRSQARRATATRVQLELFVRTLEERGLAASTIDRRLSTVCGFYRFAHIDGRIPSNPAQYVRRPKVHPSQARGLDSGELGAFLFTAERFDHAHAALAMLLGLNALRVSEACSVNIEDLGMERGHRILRIVGKGNKPAVIPSFPELPGPSTSPSVSGPPARSLSATTARDSTGARPTAGSERLANWPLSARCIPICFEPDSSWPR